MPVSVVGLVQSRALRTGAGGHERAPALGYGLTAHLQRHSIVAVPCTANAGGLGRFSEAENTLHTLRAENSACGRDMTVRGRRSPLGSCRALPQDRAPPQTGIGAGGVLLILALLRPQPLALIVGLALVLGGLALLGSNQRTLDETLAAIRAAEARRAEMIDGLRLLNVDAENK